MNEKYEAFITFKNTIPEGGLTVDRMIAERLHSRLVAEGLNVFFSEKNLSETEFMEQIYAALDEAELLIVVCTDPEHVRSKWVKSEWTNFLGAINSDRKPNGKIMNVLSGMNIHGLPLELSNYPSFNADNLEEAVAYAFDVLGRVRNSEAQKRLDEENARQLRQAEEEKQQAIKGQMEAERREEIEKEKAELADKKAEAAEQKAEDEKKKRLAAEKKAKNGAGFWHKKWFIGVVAGCVWLIFLFVLWAMPSWKYENNADGGITITGYSGLWPNITIPEEIDGKKVTVIGSRAFQCKHLVWVRIPDTVTTIEDYAFLCCFDLKSLTIPDSVTDIESHSFAGCENLRSLTIGDGIEYIDPYAFAYCRNLTTVRIGNSVKIIDSCAFAYCESLTSISFPDSVELVGDEAFFGCSSLKSVEFSRNFGILGKKTFGNCSSLTEITVSPDNEYYCAVDNVLMSKIQFTLYLVPGGRSGKLEIPDGVRHIDDYAVYNCDGLTSVTIPDSVHDIGDYAFYNCDGLTSITIPDKVEKIGDNAFSDCDNLLSASIGRSVTSIGNSAFKDCENLISVTIGVNVTSIGSDAFKDCPNLIVYAPHPSSFYGTPGTGYKKWNEQ